MTISILSRVNFSPTSATITREILVSAQKNSLSQSCETVQPRPKPYFWRKNATEKLCPFFTRRIYTTKTETEIMKNYSILNMFTFSAKYICLAGHFANVQRR